MLTAAIVVDVSHPFLNDTALYLPKSTSDVSTQARSGFQSVKLTFTQ